MHCVRCSSWCFGNFKKLVEKGEINVNGEEASPWVDVLEKLKLEPDH